jgi:hypothetical protein
MEPRITINSNGWETTVEVYWPMDQETEYLDAIQAVKRNLVTVVNGKLTLIKK